MVYSTTDLKLTVNEPKELRTKIMARVSAYSKRSEEVFNEILKLHPKFRPKYFERSHHIFCIKLEQNKKNKVTFDEIKVFSNFISQKLDIPVSVQADGEIISLAMFWDTRVLGSAKMLDFATHQACSNLDIDQFAEVTLETAIDAETLLIPNADVPRTVPHLILDGFVINAKTQIC